MDPILAVVVVSLASLLCVLAIVALILRVAPRDSCDAREGESIRCRNCQARIALGSDGDLPDGFTCPSCGVDPITEWLSCPTECRVCGHEDVRVWPASAGSRDLECARCGCMACDPVAAD